MAWMSYCLLAVILVVVMCVLVTVVDPAIAANSDIRSMQLHIAVKSP